MKLTITGDAYVLTSSVKVKDIELLKKYNPDALKILSEENTIKFIIAYKAGKPCVVDFGITFGGATRDENGYATFTDNMPAGLNTAEAAKEYLADKFGGIVAYLQALEASIPEAVKKVQETRKTMMDAITVE